MSSYITNLVQIQSLIVSEIPTKLSFVGPAIPHSDFVLVCQFLQKQNVNYGFINAQSFHIVDSLRLLRHVKSGRLQNYLYFYLEGSVSILVLFVHT